MGGVSISMLTQRNFPLPGLRSRSPALRYPIDIAALYVVDMITATHQRALACGSDVLIACIDHACIACTLTGSDSV